MTFLQAELSSWPQNAVPERSVSTWTVHEYLSDLKPNFILFCKRSFLENIFFYIYFFIFLVFFLWFLGENDFWGIILDFLEFWEFFGDFFVAYFQIRFFCALFFINILDFLDFSGGNYLILPRFFSLEIIGFLLVFFGVFF